MTKHDPLVDNLGHVGRNPADDHAAALTVCARAADPADAVQLLAALGLLHQPTTPKRRPQPRPERCRWCERPMVADKTPGAVPPGAARHAGHGLCRRCHTPANLADLGVSA